MRALPDSASFFYPFNNKAVSFPSLNCYNWNLQYSKGRKRRERTGFHLHCAEGVEKMRIVVLGGAEPATWVLARTNKVKDFRLAHASKLTHEIHCCQPPVHPAHSQELRHAVILNEARRFGLFVIHRITPTQQMRTYIVVLVLLEGLDVRSVFFCEELLCGWVVWKFNVFDGSTLRKQERGVMA